MKKRAGDNPRVSIYSIMPYQHVASLFFTAS